VQPRCQAERHCRAIKLGAAVALPSLTPPPRCQEIVHESKLALFSFLSMGDYRNSFLVFVTDSSKFRLTENLV
jgi:hypothetical protein